MERHVLPKSSLRDGVDEEEEAERAAPLLADDDGGPLSREGDALMVGCAIHTGVLVDEVGYDIKRMTKKSIVCCWLPCARVDCFWRMRHGREGGHDILCHGVACLLSFLAVG